MNSLNTVQILGKVTIPPKIRTLKNGSKVAEVGMGIPDNFKNDKGEWANRMHFVDVILWDTQANFVEEHISKGDGMLVQGALQFDQWEAKDGSKRSKVRVKGYRVQMIQFPEPAHSTS